MELQKQVARVATLPVVPLRGMVVFPKTEVHLDLVRPCSVSALEAAVSADQCLFLCTQKDMNTERPTFADLYEIGVVAKIRQVMKLPSDTVRILVEGLYRAKVRAVEQEEPFLLAQVKECAQRPIGDPMLEQAYVRQCRLYFEHYVQAAGELSEQEKMSVRLKRQAGTIADRIAFLLPAPAEEKMPILEALSIETRAERLLTLLADECELLELESGIEQKVQRSMDKNQRDYYLHEQLKAINEELGESDSPSEEAEQWREKIRERKLPAAIEEKLLKECDRLSKMPFGAHESTVVLNYLEYCLDMPWGIFSEDKNDNERSRRILERDHYGLKEVKERILELLAVRQLTGGTKGQVICLVGPPGVGKTSIAKSIAEALGRTYVRLSLGGIKDEAEIRGHRKTYIGAMPGRIAEALTHAKTMNPVMLLDEVDKLGSGINGDPTSALLEVLDTEQNTAFRDHYLEMPVDLSQVLFITTANDATAIPEPLYDRMDVITLSSYTAEEKYQIARRHLVEKQLKNNGLTKGELRFSEAALRAIIDGYTREGGVRELERRIGTVCRKQAQKIVNGESEPVTITAKTLKAFLGARKYKDDEQRKQDEVGVVNGLAWTAVGGETMPIEVAILDGTGKIELTGSLGDVMKESARTAISYVRSAADLWNIEKEFYKNKDIHIHVPEGAVPKDGPSAGVTMATAVVSALTGIPVRHDVAMTGEISLRGRVLPIGGLKEKTMAAYRHHFSTVVIPKDNEPDLEQIDETVRKNLKFVTARTVDTVIRTALKT